MKKLLIPLLISLIIILLPIYPSNGLTTKTKGHITIAFDDGYQNEYDYAFPLLKARGINATYYVISDSINQEGYMSVDMLHELEDSGSEIGSHSATHAWFPGLPDEQMRKEFSSSKEKLQAYGLEINNFAFPYGGIDDYSIDMASQYYRSARSAYAEPYIMDFPPTTFLISGYPGEEDDSIVLPYLQSIVDWNMMSGGWTIIFFHNVVPSPDGNPVAISTQNFETFLDYLVEKGVETLTVNQALDKKLDQPLSIELQSFQDQMEPYESQTINSEISGGEAPYIYKWFINNIETPNSHGASLTFTPIEEGYYDIHLSVIDQLNTTTKSNTAQINVINTYRLTMATNYGTTTPPSDDYNEGTTVTITAQAPTATKGERYIWQGWTGQGEGSYTGTNNPAQITINSDITQTAKWLHQYNVTINTTGIDSSSNGTIVTINGTNKTIRDIPYKLWVNDGSTINCSFKQVILSNITGKQFILNETNIPSSTLTIKTPITIQATYKTQYILTETAKIATTNSSSTWYDNGSKITLEVNPILMVNADTRYACTGWSGSGNIPSSGIQTKQTITISEPSTIRWNWKTQYLISFTAQPTQAGNISFMDQNIWLDKSTITINATSNQGYKFETWTTTSDSITINDPTNTQTTATINAPGKITANFTPIPTPTTTPTNTPSDPQTENKQPTPTQFNPTSSPTTSPTPPKNQTINPTQTPIETNQPEHKNPTNIGAINYPLTGLLIVTTITVSLITLIIAKNYQTKSKIHH